MTIEISKEMRFSIDKIKSVADANRHSIGFLLRPTIEEAMVDGRTIIAVVEDHLIGFMIYRHRKRDGQTTVSAVCIDEEWRGMGIGRLLIEALVQECRSLGREFVQLKCPEDLPANDFYKRLGFQLIRVEEGKQRKLLVWRKYLFPDGQA